MKRYVWGFPGIGKSSLKLGGIKVVDADCELFKFKDVSQDDLHNIGNTRVFEPDDNYPHNFLDYVQSVDADIVLLNCHLTLLNELNKDDILIVYPCKELAEEYITRYQKRGDNTSFGAYMMQEWDGLVQYIEASDFDRYQVFSRDTYLSDLFERNDFKMKVMTTKEITEQLQRAMDLGVLKADDSIKAITFNDAFANISHSNDPIYKLGAQTLAHLVLEGKYDLDIDRLQMVCATREAQLKRERETLVSHFQRAIDLNVLDTSAYNNAIICDISFVNDGIASADVHDAYDLADAVISGKYTVDIDNLKAVCKQREEQLVEMQYADRRGGLSREELADKIMQGIVNGALGIRYDQIAPYSHGYEVTFGGNGPVGSTREFKNRWECYKGGFFDVPGKIVSMIENSQQDGRVFGAKAQSLDIKELLAAIDEMEGKQITSFVPAKDSGLEKRGRYTGHVASVMDVHKGLALDGIVQHYYHGDYSSMTPSRQNDLVETLVFMKGFCLDCLSGSLSDRQQIVDYLKKHGTDISTPEMLQDWILLNPEKCGKEGNRALSFVKRKELYGQAFKDVTELNSLVNDFKGSLEDLCIKLGGQNFDGELFDVNYGVIAATIELKDGVLVLNQNSIDIWDDPAGGIFEEWISVRELKAVCKQYGIDVGDKLTLDREGHVFNDEQKLYAQAYCDLVELQALVSDYGNSFDKLCDRLGGDRFDDNTFHLDYGVIAVSIELSDGEVFLNESIGVYDRAHEDFVDNFGSFKRLKEVCKEIGFDTKQLEAEALTVLCTEKPSLSAQIEAGASKSGGKVSDKDVDKDRGEER